MRPKRVFFVAFLIALSLPGYARAAEFQFTAVRDEAVQRLDRLKALVTEAEERGIDTARERVTIVTAELFLSYVEWDAGHPEQLREAIGAWWRVRDEADEISRELPGKELGDIVSTIDVTIRELESVLKRPASRRATPAVDHSALEIVRGYFHFNGRPTFPSSFVWMPRDRQLLEAFGNIDGIYMAPSQKKSPDAKARFSYRSDDDMQTMGRVFFGHGRMPAWARKAYPDIEVGQRHFTAYDIDHPGTREVWQGLLSDTVPHFAGKRVTQGGYLLANEPHWFSATGQWATGPVSDFTMAEFREWLAQRHGTVLVLNSLWGKDFASFDDVILEIPIDTNLRGTPVWHDWCRFNMDRVTDWFFYSETAAIQDGQYMDRVYESYKTLYHLGLPPGFVTGRMLSEADEETLDQWATVIVSRAGHVTAREIQALSRYLSQGGTVVVSGENSPKSDEYGRPHDTGLETGRGRLIHAASTEISDVESLVGPLLPRVGLAETNSTGMPGCVWRTCPWQDGHLLLIINLGKSEARLEIAGKSNSCRDLISNAVHPTEFDLKSFGLRLLLVQ